MLTRYTSAILDSLRPSVIWLTRRRSETLDLRYGRAALTFAASGAASLATILVNLVTVPLLLHHLGNARFGVWMTLYSLVSILGVFDFGVGLGLLTALAQCYGRNDRGQAQRFISTAIVILISIAILFLLLFALMYPLIPWSAVFNVRDSVLVNETRYAMAILVPCLVLAIPASLPARVQAGYQRGYIASMWDLLTRITILFGVVAVAYSDAGLPWLVAVVAGMPALMGGINGLVYFTFQSPWLRPSLQTIDYAAARSIIYGGGLFFVLQVVFALTFASDNIVITQILGPQEVAAYAVPRTLFQSVTVATTLFLAPLWPAYGEALAKGDRAWVANTLKRSLWLGTSFSLIGAAILLLFGKNILVLWTGSDLNVSYSLLFGFALWVIMSTCGSAISMLMNAAFIMRFQVIVAVAMALCAIAAKIVLARRFGVTGVIWGTVIAYAFISFLPSVLYARRWLNESYVTGVRA